MVMPRNIEPVAIWCTSDTELEKPVGLAAQVEFDIDSSHVSLQVTNGPIVAIAIRPDGKLQIEIHDMGSKTPVMRTNTGGLNEEVQLWPDPSA